jgi:4-hydroxy-tetrahydrodipicolinate reductase
MKIALIGYGKMGKAIERIALERGHEISSIIDIDNKDEWQSDGFKAADAAIEFTIPGTAVENYYRCFDAGVPVVSGTTGWLAEWDAVKKRCLEGNHTFFYASNFSIGVNIFFALNKQLAKIMDNFPAYNVRMKEIHHIHKKDAPSGTAITLAEGIVDSLGRKERWSLDEVGRPENLHIESVREGEVPGTHEIIYESVTDYIRICHEAKGREGFALGAVVAAEFAVGKQGVLGMEDMLSF